MSHTPVSGAVGRRCVAVADVLPRPGDVSRARHVLRELVDLDLLCPVAASRGA
ncbi:MAG: hypothetical protein WB797_12705 [Nocardioides sp.]